MGCVDSDRQRDDPSADRLGRKLYFDVRLSADSTVSCATCHDTMRGFTDQRPVSEGIGDQLGRRHAPTTLNAALLTTLFLDGRAADLEEQARLPIINPIEMGHPSKDAAVAAISGMPSTTGCSGPHTAARPISPISDAPSPPSSAP
ncbi:MAG: cytochrome-c peroxidase [Proteobacteria bacterium]|nr:cytochrome-c peroxidase [Pseudomonadota bacterium]